MGLQLRLAKADEATYFKLTKQYVKELRHYDSSIVLNMENVRASVNDARLLMLDEEAIGFFACTLVRHDGYQDILGICELYICPPYRRKGYGERCVAAIERGWGGAVFLHIHQKNMPAKNFWAQIEQRHHWRRIQRPDIPEIPGSNLRAFIVPKDTEERS